MIQNGFVKAKAELLRAPGGERGGISVQWQTTTGDVLQIVTNFSTHALPRPPLIAGETLWGPGQTSEQLYLNPAEILARRSSASRLQALDGRPPHISEMPSALAGTGPSSAGYFKKEIVPCRRDQLYW
jgi:hypothetical protein